MQIAVIGVGQSLRGDDAVGLEVLRQWQENFPETANRPEVRIEACELPGIALLDILQDVNAAIFVDAIQGDFSTGSIHLLDESELAAFLSDAKSAHGWGLAETLKLGSALTGVKVNIKVIGVQIEQTEIGAVMSKAVQEAIPHACELLEKEVNKLM